MGILAVMPVAKTVEEMILNLTRKEKVIVDRLRALVHECLPKAIEKGYYGEGVPFYTHNRMICFIWPSSVYWGPKRTAETQKSKGVSLGFCQGNLMSNEDGVLQAEGRKQVYVMYFHSLADINEEQVRALLYEAGMIDETFKKKKSAKRKKVEEIKPN
jgi:hypothetical protein